jgi:WD40 repeat protein
LRESQWYHPSVNRRQKETEVWAALLVFLCSLPCAINARAQGNSSPQLSTFQIPLPPGLAVGGAALSPDGERVAVAFVPHRRALADQQDIVVSVRIWNVGTHEPIGSRQVSLRRADASLAVRESNVGTFVHYCENGWGIMVADPSGTLSYLNPQTLEILHTTPTNIDVDPSGRRWKAVCAVNGRRAVVTTFGGLAGPAGHKKTNDTVRIRVFDLSSGALLREWNLENSPPFGDVAISPSGDQIAVSYVATNSLTGRPEAIPNLELFNVNTGEVTLRLKTGHLPGGISFVGETRVATADTNSPGLFWKPEIKAWDTSNGKLVREFGDPEVGARRRVGASSDGNVILGYIPHETLKNGTKTEDWTVEARFRLWDVTTGQTIATSPLLPPNRSSVFTLGLDVSANGRAVIVFSSGSFPICVFSITQSAPAHW